MRLKVQEMITSLNQAKMFVLNHNSSIGYIGEEIIRTFLRQTLPKQYTVTQGFVSDGVRVSPQCDIIIYDCQNYTPCYSYGSIEVVPAHAVVATIEVKTSINSERFSEVLKRFKALNELGVESNSLLVFSYIMPRTLENYFYKSLSRQVAKGNIDYNTELGIYTTDTYTFDVSDYNRFPSSILVLENGYCMCQEQVQDMNHDYYGFAAYQITDGDDKEISSLHIFMDFLLNAIQPAETKQSIPPFLENTIDSQDEIKELCYKYAFPICPM